MNVFMPELSALDSVRALDDRRLVKQILECKQIIRANDRVLAGETKVGYANHPIVKFYRDKRDFLIFYGFAACLEYWFRFGRVHQYEEYFSSELAVSGSPDFYHIYYMDKRPKEYELEAIYSANDVDLTQVHRAYRAKLAKKWMADGNKARWTNRERPSWGKHENQVF